MFKINTILVVLSKIRDFIGKERLYNWAKPGLTTLVRNTIDFKDDDFEEDVENVIIATTDIMLKFALDLPLDYISEKEKKLTENKKQLQP